MSRKNKKKTGTTRHSAAEQPGGGPAEFAVALGARRRACEVLPHLTAARLPIVMTAIEAVAVQPGNKLRPIATLASAIESKDVAGPAVQRVAAQWGQSTEEAVETAKRHLPADTGPRSLNDYLNTIYAGYWAPAAAVRSRRAFFSTPETTALILAGAGAKIKAFGTSIADLPAPAGMAYLARDDDEDLFLMWAATTSTLMYVSLVTASGLAVFLGQDGHSTGWDVWNTRYLPMPTTYCQMSPPESDTPPETLRVQKHKFYAAQASDDQRIRDLYAYIDDFHIMSVLLSFTHIMRQESLIEATPAQTSRANTTAGKGGKRTPSDITYLSYRPRTRGPIRGSANTVPRTYSHRWTVRAHWRRQFFPSQNRHIPILIVEHIAGPEGAPIKTTNKITLVRPPRESATDRDGDTG